MTNIDIAYRPYFGVADMAREEMIEAVTGRLPSGIKAELDGFQLCEWPFAEFPPPAQEILRKHWDPEIFRDYGIYALNGSSVSGVIWFLTPEEYKLVQAWHLVPDWYTSIEVSVKWDNPEPMLVRTEMIPKGRLFSAQIEERYAEPYLNGKTKTLRLAHALRALTRA